MYSVYSVSLVYCTYAWTNRWPIRKINRRRIDERIMDQSREIHRWYICLQFMHNSWSTRVGTRKPGGGKKTISKRSRGSAAHCRVHLGLAISPYRQLVSSKLLRGVENHLRHEALSKGYPVVGCKDNFGCELALWPLWDDDWLVCSPGSWECAQYQCAVLWGNLMIRVITLWTSSLSTSKF